MSGRRKDSGDRRRPGGLSPEDEALWQRVSQTAKPLRKRRPATPPPVPPEAEPGPQSGDADAASGAPPRQHQARPAPALPPLAAGEAPGVDRRTADRLRRGKLAIEARIDLHGLTQDEAHAALSGFIADARSAGKRCVLVITGKGLRPDGRRGVLRDAVPRWLNLPALRPHLLAFAHAQPRDGGEGALYVLLRRSRGEDG